LIVWECQTKCDKLEVLERRLRRFLGENAAHSVGRGSVKQAKANSKARRGWGTKCAADKPRRYSGRSRFGLGGNAPDLSRY
jgi:hypothetical protein